MNRQDAKTPRKSTDKRFFFWKALSFPAVGLDSLSLGSSWRLGALAVIFAFSAGCVPIRQYVPGRLTSKPTATGTPVEFESPDDFKHLDKDAWKGEMEGVASWYGEEFNGRLTASGDVYDMYKMTAAHKTLPLGTVVKVTNEDNGMTAQVTINDRGPYVKGRIIDLSKTAGRAIGMREAGTANVRLEVVSWPK